jgi:protein-S-isoprenylcysteine O-methyltransferase Ste14
MKRALIGSIVFFCIVPVTVAGWVPWWITHWRFDPPFLGLAAFRIPGIPLLCFGIPVLIDSCLRFAIQGLGTPAPVAPPKKLVVSGLYRFVRNPMYVAVVSTILGQGLLFGNNDLLIYAACVWLTMHTFVVVYEEPRLRAQFGGEYESFLTAVPRWIPRLRPVEGE